MARYVLIDALAKAMADYAPPAWCKLAIYGAIHTQRVQLYAAHGSVMGYLPAFTLRAPESILPPRIKPVITKEELIDIYGIEVNEIPNKSIIRIWDETWTDEPHRIATGWAIFTPPWDWDEPHISYESFEIPNEYSEIFGFDDIHPEGAPDTWLTYDCKLWGLCLVLEEAESIAPMADLDALAFGRKTAVPTRKIGRPRGSGFESADAPLVERMLAEKKQNPALSIRFLAEKYANEAAGHGTIESKIKRLEKRLWPYGI